MIEKLLNNKEICELLGVSYRTWRKMREESPKPVMFAPNLYKESDIVKWQAERSKMRKAG